MNEPKKYKIKEVKSMILREVQVDNPLMDTPDKVAEFLIANLPLSITYRPDVENLIVAALNTRRRLVAFEILSQGLIDSVIAHPREIFKFAILNNAAAIILAHNHPSGDAAPSEADIKITRDMISAGQLMKIEVLDHLILGDESENNNRGWTSLRELGYFYS